MYPVVTIETVRIIKVVTMKMIRTVKLVIMNRVITQDFCSSKGHSRTCNNKQGNHSRFLQL